MTTQAHLEVLTRSIPEADGREAHQPPEYQDMQRMTRSIAFDGGWSPERAEQIRGLFDSLAPEWYKRSGPERAAPLQDALARGGIGRSGRALEIGSGTGLQTPALSDHFAEVISVDLAWGMLARSPRGTARLVQADAAALPFPDASLNAVVCVNAFLFAREYDRVLATRGALVFVSTYGERTPIYLAPSEVLAALPGRWRGVTSEACWGTWTVGRRQVP